MAITRRQFIKRTGAVAAGTLLGPSLFSNPLLRKALADTIGDRYFIVVYLDGGNDGLNTVTPATNGGGTLRDAYDAARLTGGGGLNLSPGDLASTHIGTDPNTGAQIALHPGLIGLKNLWDLGKLAVVQGCGYPDYSLSHDQSRSIWQTANPLGLTGGWVGRYLAANYGGSEIPAVNIADSVVGEFKTAATSIITLDRLEDFGFPYDEFDGGSDDGFKRTAFLALCNAASGNAQSVVKYIGDSGNATLLGSESYPGLHSLYENDRGTIWDPQYDAVGRSLANDLREVAKVIYGVTQGVPNVNARFFQVRNGGYDTHSDQGAAQTDGQHYGLHRELGDSLNVFYQDCADMGVANKVCIVVWSEFSRRIQQNDSGTDHGSQAPVFVIGGAVRGGPSGGSHGGVYGNHPNIDDTALDDEGNTVYKQGADPFRSTDLRDVYGTILKHWLGMTDPGDVLTADGGDPDFYWTSPNFDLGFL
ncbi:MAG: DUF1501 domain-containing protein [Deltaproteobacteria bacterium]|nr:DUF1501 domain-containing protein [Deltaproteobacteria bacterium]